MATAHFAMRAVLLEQKERTMKTSKADIERFIEESESKIISLESQINALVELRDRERACVAALRHLISPIHALPVELLAEIFELTIRNRNHIKDLLRISQVCSNWRQVAHHTPRLWTRPMEIDVRQRRSGDGDQIYADGLKTWLLRAAPLTVPISFLLNNASMDYRIPDQILSTAPRWRSFHLSHTTSFSVVSQLAKARLENLEELGLKRVESNEDNSAPFTLTASTVPRLQKLRLSIYPDALPIVVPWVQLTDLTLRTHIANLALDILAQCTSLIRAVVRTPGLAVLTEARQDILVLDHLQTLSIRFFQAAEHFIPFLGCLSAPALKELCLDFERTTTVSWSETHFTAFQLRAPNVTQLELKWSCLTSDDLRIALRHAPFLTHLKIAFCDCVDDALLDALCYKAGAVPPAPHLQNLFLDAIGDNFTEDILAGMIASRWWTDAELAARLVPPAVARWTRIELYRDEFTELFFGMLEYLPSDILIKY